MADVNKVIVTNIGALRRKHRTAGMRRIDRAIRALIRADAARGVVSRLVAIDRKSDMRGIGRAVTRATDRRQAKRAIDEVFEHFQPQYLMLLGAPDVVPHQQLVNPLFDPDGDVDRRVPSDLPYACPAGYSTDISEFLGPTRVVGRLPDVNGRRDTAYLLRLLAGATSWKTRRRRSYGKMFGISAESWKRSTRTSARKVIGSRRGVNLSPTDGPKWTRTELRDRVHFINCHGQSLTSLFYGENEHDEFDQPVAHEAAHLAGRVRDATVVAAECCDGAELYEPVGDAPVGICQTYLDEGAYGFFGSTNIAYGPASGTGLADVVCIEFVKAVLDGASLGRATLTAQQKFIQAGGRMGPDELKTLAQFLLLGDPSIHPVKPSRAARKRRSAAKKKRRPRGKKKALHPRLERRKQLARRGARILATTATVSQKPDARLGKALQQRILDRCGGLASFAKLSFRLRRAPEPGRSEKSRKLAKARTIFHVLIESPKRLQQPRAKGAVGLAARAQPAVKTARMVIAREVNGKIEETSEYFRHG